MHIAIEKIVYQYIPDNQNSKFLETSHAPPISHIYNTICANSTVYTYSIILYSNHLDFVFLHFYGIAFSVIQLFFCKFALGWYSTIKFLSHTIQPTDVYIIKNITNTFHLLLSWQKKKKNCSPSFRL